MISDDDVKSVPNDELDLRVDLDLDILIERLKNVKESISSLTETLDSLEEEQDEIVYLLRRDPQRIFDIVGFTCGEATWDDIPLATLSVQQLYVIMLLPLFSTQNKSPRDEITEIDRDKFQFFLLLAEGKLFAVNNGGEDHPKCIFRIK